VQDVAIGEPAIGSQLRERVGGHADKVGARDEPLVVEALAARLSVRRDQQVDDRGDRQRRAGLVEVGNREVVEERLADRRLESSPCMIFSLRVSRGWALAR